MLLGSISSDIGVEIRVLFPPRVKVEIPGVIAAGKWLAGENKPCSTIL